MAKPRLRDDKAEQLLDEIEQWLKEDNVGQPPESETVEQRDPEFEHRKSKLEKARNEAAERAAFDGGLLRQHELAALEKAKKTRRYDEDQTESLVDEETADPITENQSDNWLEAIGKLLESEAKKSPTDVEVVEGQIKNILSRMLSPDDLNEALMICAKRGMSPGLIPILIELGASVDQRDSNGYSPFRHIAGWCKDTNLLYKIAAARAHSEEAQGERIRDKIIPTEPIDVDELRRAEISGQLDKYARKRLADHVESELKKSNSTKNNFVAESKDSLEIARVRTQEMLLDIGLAAEKHPAVMSQILAILETELGHAREGQEAPLNLPDEAPERYKDRPRDLHTGRRETIPVFLERVWKPWIDAGVLTRPDFRRLDPEGDIALQNWLRNPDNKLPVHLRILKKSEVIDRKLGDASTDELREAWRIADTVRRRQKQALAH